VVPQKIIFNLNCCNINGSNFRRVYCIYKILKRLYDLALYDSALYDSALYDLALYDSALYDI